MPVWDVTLQSAAGRQVTLTVLAETGSKAAAKALRHQNQKDREAFLQDQHWLALHCIARS